MYCECGCGGLVSIAKKGGRGYRKGEPRRFIHGHHMRTAEYKALVFTAERAAKISAAHTDGRIPTIVPSRGGPGHPSWQGEDIGYAHAHTRVVAERGLPTGYLCDGCGGNAQEWAINHDHAGLRYGVHSGLRKAYSADTSAYVPLCRSCHRRADRRGGYRCRTL